MLNGEPHYLTREGLEGLKKELHDLKTIKRPEVAQKIANAKELGDLSENAEYQDAKDELAFMEGRIQQLEDVIAHAAVIEEKQSIATGRKIINIGSTVIAKTEGKKVMYQIVGSNEADPKAGRISNESPLGRSFLGKAEGEDVEVITPGGIIIYKIVEIQ